MTDPRPIDSLSFEDSLQELETIVKRLESSDVSLEQSIADYTRGTELKKHCDTRLKDAELKVEQISQKGPTQTDGGNVDTLPF